MSGRAIPIMPRLVQLVGLNEAIILQQVRYSLRDEARPHVREGRRWVTASYAEWQREHFPFWHADTVERTFRSLERRKILIARTFNASRRDHTKWYTVDFDLLLEWERGCRAALGAGPLPPDPYRPVGPDAVDGPAAPLPPPPATDLLLDEYPLLLLPQLAVLVGVDEALVLQQVRYWLADRRGPLVRDGRRWARFSQDAWQAQFPFRSKDTVARAFRHLEAAGLLRSSSRYNPEPGDRTKAYTIDFERLAALRAAGRLATSPVTPVLGATDNPDGACGDSPDTAPARGETAPNRQSAANQNGNVRRLEDDSLRQTAANQDRNLRWPEPQSTATEGGKLRPSIARKTLVDPLLQTRNEQHQGAGHRPGTEPVSAVVAVPDRPDGDVLSRLVERGVTRSVAERLVRRTGPEVVLRQLDVFDWLCEASPSDGRLTPGRLRRMIEEDWTAPMGFVPAAARARLMAAERVAEEELLRRQEHAREEERRRREAAEAEYTALLTALGLQAHEQTIWRILVDCPRRLPSVFARALFYGPREDTPPIIIFRERTDCEVVASAAYAQERAEVERRLCDRFPGHVRARLAGGGARYLAYDDIRAALNESPAGAANGVGGQAVFAPATEPTPVYPSGSVSTSLRSSAGTAALPDRCDRVEGPARPLVGQ